MYKNPLFTFNKGVFLNIKLYISRKVRVIFRLIVRVTEKIKLFECNKISESAKKKLKLKTQNISRPHNDKAIWPKFDFHVHV